MRLLRANPRATVGVAVLVLLTLAALLAGWLAPYDPGRQVGAVFAPPGPAHPLGLDDGGHDVLSLLLYGTRPTLFIGAAAALVAVLVGGCVGVTAGYFGGWVDTLLMRITDYAIVIPALPLGIVIAAVWGSSIGHLVVVIALLLWTSTARVVRAETSSLRNRPYVQRIRGLGASHLRVIGRHLLPQLAPLLSAMAALTIALAIFTETALTFLGLGDPETVTWGTMIRFAFQRTAMTQGAWWAFAPPGVAVSLVVMCCYWVSQSIEDTLNPRLRVAHLAREYFKVVPR
ncbi:MULTISPECIES: ABC transporter permease [Streptosporangium]|uniref:ABC transporter permease n=1 Tax=Streptosporangium jomthongense TaxID=1193683 RepID=A0ABV8F413_9ACTN